MRVTWSGKHRAPLDDIGVYPRPLRIRFRVWVAVGESPESAVAPACWIAHGAGDHRRAARTVRTVRRDSIVTAEKAGHGRLPLSINSHTYVADTSQRAAEEFFPSYAEMMNAIGRERGWSGIRRPDFDALRTRRGALVVGSPQEVIEKILFQREIFDHDRFLGQISVGTMPHDKVMRAIELLGTEVAPVVREEVARSASPVAPVGQPT